MSIGAWRRALWRLRQPIAAEKKALLARRWAELPDDLRTDWQILGRQIVHCGYTLGAAYCSFGCTHCYLPRNANRAPLPSLTEMKEQIDANARLVGENGGLQITGGDVLDAYWRSERPEELIEILRYANDVGVAPMLMTHGQVLLDHPDYLDLLVEKGGLRKLAIHVDTTQAGRPGFPIRGLRREADLDPLRQQFVDLLLACRGRTGARVQAAHTVTVTERNLDSIGDILRWLVGHPDRLRVFRMISFQTEAAVGRTRSSQQPVTPEETWAQICRALETELPRDNLWIGDPRCSSMTTVLFDFRRRRATNLIGSSTEDRLFWKAVLDTFGGVGSRGLSDLDANAQRLALALRHPSIALRALVFARTLLRRERGGPGLALSGALGRVAPLNVVLHNFMDEQRVAARTAEVEQRLAACSFRGAVRRGGGWEAVPMCAMNSLEREAPYARQIERGGEAASGV